MYRNAHPLHSYINKLAVRGHRVQKNSVVCSLNRGGSTVNVTSRHALHLLLAGGDVLMERCFLASRNRADPLLVDFCLCLSSPSVPSDKLPANAQRVHKSPPNLQFTLHEELSLSHGYLLSS